MTLRLGMALLAVALTAGCGTAQSALPLAAADAPLRYSTYLTAQGQPRGEHWALALMGHAAHREQVYLQAQQGLYPASEAWPYLESVCRGAGALTAQEHSAPQCALLPPELGCEFNWNPVRALMPGEGPGKQRLMDVYQQGYDTRWAQLKRRFHARVETGRAGMLMAGVLLGRTPAAAEGESPVVAEGRALGAEARAVAVDAQEAGANAARLLSAETLGLNRALGAEEASALEARLLEMEAKSPGTREAFSSEELRSGQLAPRARPSQLPGDSSLWREFEAYRQRRFQEVRAQGRGGAGPLTVKPPFRWEAYQQFREHFLACNQFETEVGGVLMKEVEQPAGSRRVLGGLQRPLIARHVGTKKSGSAGVRYPDYLVVDEATLEEGSAPRVESVSVKKRDFRNWSAQEVKLQVKADVQEALSQYGGWLEVRRFGHPLFGQTVQVSKVHLVMRPKARTAGRSSFGPLAM
jgi:hypothetical protein